MKRSNLFILIFTFIACTASAQNNNFHFPKKQIDAFNKSAYQKICARENILPNSGGNIASSGFMQLMKFKQALHLSTKYFSLKGKSTTSNDTLIVTDTLLITGTYSHNGPVIIINGGFLHFKNASATILGDIYVWGANSRLYADSSTLYIPQQYFYQRSLVVIDGGIVHYHNTTLDHSGLSHNLLAGKNSYIEMVNVQNNGFTTNSVNSNAQISINGTNEAGEYVTMDSARLNFKNANTILLWHQFPDTSVINFSFPKGDTVSSYKFNKTLPGVHGVEYSIVADTCTNVMWGMMPVTGSNVTISNSKIRSIGLWFTGSDTIAVNGLVNNSHYTTFTAGLSDRNLQLDNCDVQTWSIYPMNKSHVDLSGCIVGEVGTEQHSSFTGLNFTCDGSGGYMWATDTTVVMAGYCSDVNAVRSQGNGIVLFAYSSLMGGYPSALNNSVIMVIQSNVQQEPVPLDNACAWYAMIEQPFNAYTDSIAAITGSAWIVKTASSSLMDFQSYRLYYQQNGATSWSNILTDSLHARHNDTLGIWNTSGFSAGQYNIKLVLRDNWGNTAEAIKGVNLMPKILAGIEEDVTQSMNCFPNPATDKLNIVFNVKQGRSVSVKLFNELGKEIYSDNGIANSNSFSIDTRRIPAGIYLLNVSCDGNLYNKVVAIK